MFLRKPTEQNNRALNKWWSGPQTSLINNIWMHHPHLLVAALLCSKQIAETFHLTICKFLQLLNPNSWKIIPILWMDFSLKTLFTLRVKFPYKRLMYGWDNSKFFSHTVPSYVIFRLGLFSVSYFTFTKRHQEVIILAIFTRYQVVPVSLFNQKEKVNTKNLSLKKCMYQTNICFSSVIKGTPTGGPK